MKWSSRTSLIIGASGQVGSALMERLARTSVGTYETHPFEGGVKFSLEDAATDPAALCAAFNKVRPSVVYIVGGMTWVDGCEDQPDKCMRINRNAPAAVAEAARAIGAKTVFFSSEYVFDGRDGPYSENDTPNPLSVYGRSKAAAEDAILDADPNALIIRTIVVYGPETIGKNFAYTLASNLRAGKPFQVPTDQVSSPTYNRDLADAVVRLAEQNASGIYHVAGPEVMSRCTFALRLAAAARLNQDLIRSVPTAQLSQKAPRPLNAGLQIDKLKATLPGFSPKTVEEAAAHWLANRRGKPWPD